MSSGYVKLFSSILDSSVWTLSKEAKILWVTLLAMKGRDQTVRAALPALARRAVLTLEETQRGLDELMQPDPWSQTKEQDGRRVVAAPGGGWMIVTGEKYRNMLSKEERREYKRVWMANRRKRLRETAEESLSAKGPSPAPAPEAPLPEAAPAAEEPPDPPYEEALWPEDYEEHR